MQRWKDRGRSNCTLFTATTASRTDTIYGLAAPDVLVRPRSHRRVVHQTGTVSFSIPFMQYSINLSEESDHFLRQLCDPSHGSEAVSVEDFLSAFVEEQLDELFVRRERRQPKKNKRLNDAVRSAKERAKAWSEAVIATHTALEAMRKLVADGESNLRAD